MKIKTLFKDFYEKLNIAFNKIIPFLKLFKSKFFIIWGCVFAVLLITVITLLTATVDYYELQFKGVVIGYSRSSSAVNDAISELSSAFLEKSEVVSEMGNFKVAKITSSNLFVDCYNKEEFKDVITAAAETLYKGASLYIDGERVISLASEEKINSIIESFKYDRLAVSEHLRTENDSYTVTFKEDVKVVKEHLAVSNIVTKNEYLSVYEILEDKLHYTVNCVQTLEETVPFVTYYTRNESLKAGEMVTVSKGKNGIKKVQYEVVVEGDKLVSKKALYEEVVNQPVNAKIQIGSGVTSGLGTNLGLVFPVEGYITSLFGGRPDPFTGAADNHQGLDLGAAKGTPIYAASGGKVIQASNKFNGYGKCVIIEHSSGFKTLYAHCSELLVKNGDYVTSGQLIAKVGSTGRSTGNHLHYGMMVNGVFVDPLLYY